MGTRKSRQKEIASDFTVVEDLLIELLPRFSPQLNAKLLQLRVLAPERSVAVRMPTRHLMRILQNLIENTVKKMSEYFIVWRKQKIMGIVLANDADQSVCP
ncbi:MAG: hypothetical protein ACQEWV_32290 [Bacillota bacterium]